MTDVLIRSYAACDAGAVARLFHDAIHAARGYGPAERAAWSPAPLAAEDWAARLDGTATTVAEGQDGLLGFMTLQPDKGYLAYAYVRGAAQGRGVGTALYAVLEGRARAAGLARLHCHASLAFEPFLARQGWQVVARETVERAGVPLRRAEMTKRLAAEAAA